MAFFRKPKKDDKTQAEEYFARGMIAEALTFYEKLLAAGTADIKIHRRVADLRLKVGQTEGAAKAYRKVAEMYAHSGFLVQAIAIYKILQRIDPEASDVGEKLSSLYAERGIVTYLDAQPKPAEDLWEPATLTGELERVERELPAIPLFSDLPRDIFVKMLDKLKSVRLNPGDYLFREGSPGDSIYTITSGEVEVLTHGRELTALCEGSFFGEGAYFSGKPRNADVRAGVDGAELLEIRREVLEELAECCPGVDRALRMFHRERIIDRLLATSTLMPDKSAKVRYEFERIFEHQEVEAGRVLVTEGSEGSTLYFVIRGAFEVTTIHPVTDEVVPLARIEPGNFFGEVGMLTNGNRTATVTALENSEVLSVTREAINPFLTRYPEIRKALEDAREKRAADTVDIILAKAR